MKIRHVAVAALGLAMITVAPAAFAEANDYEFQPVAADVKSGVGSEVAVRIVHKPTGKPVEGQCCSAPASICRRTAWAR